jgi:transcriptional regulator with XRE-family HTH domain
MTHDWQTQDLESQRRFARNLRAARERAQLTQADVAEAMEMTVTVYARYERGKIWPSIGALRRLCDVLGCSADTLLGLEEPAAEPEAPAAPSEPLPMRRLRRQLRQASPETLHVVEQMLDKLEEHGVLQAPDDDVADRPPEDAAGGPGAGPDAGIEAGVPASDRPADTPADDRPADTPAGDRPADDVPGDR